MHTLFSRPQNTCIQTLINMPIRMCICSRLTPQAPTLTPLEEGGGREGASASGYSLTIARPPSVVWNRWFS